MAQHQGIRRDLIFSPPLVPAGDPADTIGPVVAP